MAKGKKKGKKRVGTAKRHCGCSGRTLYIVQTPGKLKATNCKGKAKKVAKACRKRYHKAGVKARTVCTWTQQTARSPKVAKRKKRGKRS